MQDSKIENYFPFDPEKAFLAHEDTILASPMVPEDFPTPFGHSWGYLDHPGIMDKHVHEENQELFTFYRGEGLMELDDKVYKVSPGTVITVRPGVWHTVINQSEEPLLWAAFWWKELPGTAK